MQAPRRAATAMIALAVALAAPASAQTPPATDTIPLSLSETVARAVSQSEEVRLARSQVDLARAQVRGARSAALPQLDANVAYTRTFASPFQVSAPALPDSLRFEPDTNASLEERVRYLERSASCSPCC